MAGSRVYRYINGNSGISLSQWLPIMISTVVMVSILIGGFWSVASPRDDITRLNARFEQYVTLREYESLESLVREFAKEQNARTAAVERLKLLENIVNDLRTDHKELHKSMTGAVTISDALKELKLDQDRIRERINRLLISPTDLFRKPNTDDLKRSN